MKSAFIVLVIFLLFIHSAASAQTPSRSVTPTKSISEKIEIDPKKRGTLELTPAFVEVVLTEAQEEQEVEIFITNNSLHNLSLELFPIDFKQKDENGTIGFLGSEGGGYSYSLSSFLSFDSPRLELESGERRRVLIRAKNRTDLSPGGHYAAVVARNVEKTDSETDISLAVSSMILLRKTGGEQFHVSLKEVTYPKGFFQIHYPNRLRLLFLNQGNVHMVPYGTVLIKDIFGRELYKGIINPSSAFILPEARRYIDSENNKINSSFPISFNTIEVRGRDSLGKTNFIYSNQFLYINPILLAVAAIGILVIGYMKFKKMRQAKKHD